MRVHIAMVALALVGCAARGSTTDWPTPDVADSGAAEVHAPPEGALGLSFGDSHGDVFRACQRLGLSPSAYSPPSGLARAHQKCDGEISDMEISSGSMTAVFCDQPKAVCSIRFNGKSDTIGVGYTMKRLSMENGEAHELSGLTTSQWPGDAELEDVIESGRKPTAVWLWPAADIELTVRRGESRSQHSLAVEYSLR